MIKNVLILVILCLGTSCTRPEETPATTPLAPTLPVECQSLLSHAHVTGNCRFVAESPDHTHTAYVLVEEEMRPGAQDFRNIDVVKIVNQNSSKSAEIYRAVFFGIEALEWSGDGQLLIWDAHYDLAENPGVTAVYDPQAGGIVQRLNYPLRENFTFWNEPRTAFYSVLFLEIPCSTTMGGYDFARDRELPAFKPFGEADQYVKVFDSPVWSADNTELLVSVSSGTLIGETPCWEGKIEWQPSAIIKLNLAAEDLPQTLVKGDSDHDYRLQLAPDGGYEIVSIPYVPSFTQCCRGR